MIVNKKTGVITVENHHEAWCLQNFDLLLRRMHDELPRVGRRSIYHMKTNGDCYRWDTSDPDNPTWVLVCNQNRPMPNKKRFRLA